MTMRATPVMMALLPPRQTRQARPLRAPGLAARWGAALAAPLAALVTVLLAGCSQQQIYQSVQGWQQQECWRISDAAERQRCLASSATSWSDYQRQRAAAQGPK